MNIKRQKIRSSRLSLPSLRNFPFGLRCLSFEANVPRYTAVSRGFVSNFQRKYRGQVDELSYEISGNRWQHCFFPPFLRYIIEQEDRFVKIVSPFKKFDRRYYNNLFSLPLMISILLDQLTGCLRKHCGFRACFWLSH